MINCKVELNPNWTEYCVFAAGGNDNTNENTNYITFTIKDTHLCVPVSTLLAKQNQTLSKLLSKGFERSVY